MHARVLRRLLIVLLALTGIALLWNQFGMTSTMVIDARSPYAAVALDDRANAGGRSVATRHPRRRLAGHGLRPAPRLRMGVLRVAARVRQGAARHRPEPLRLDAPVGHRHRPGGAAARAHLRAQLRSGLLEGGRGRIREGRPADLRAVGLSAGLRGAAEPLHGVAVVDRRASDDARPRGARLPQRHADRVLDRPEGGARPAHDPHPAHRADRQADLHVDVPPGHHRGVDAVGVRLPRGRQPAQAQPAAAVARPARIRCSASTNRCAWKRAASPRSRAPIRSPARSTARAWPTS